MALYRLSAKKTNETGIWVKEGIQLCRYTILPE